MGVDPLRPGVLLDRDGVVNEMVYDADHGLVDSPARPDQLRLLPGAGAAIARLNAAGLPVAIVSNQPGIAKGKTTAALLDEVTRRLHALLAEQDARVDAVYYCLHHPQARLAEFRMTCDCRKPGSGLLVKAAADLDLDLRRSFMVGDGVTDVQAGRRAGCRTVWLGALKCDVCRLMRDDEATPDFMAPDLAAAVDLILTAGSDPQRETERCR